MPEVVSEFVENGDYLEARQTQELILDLYRNDFSKHAPITLVSRSNQVWDSIPAQLSKENRKFMYGQINKGAMAKDFELAIKWLEDCGLIHLVHRVSKPQIPPKAILEKKRILTEFKGAMTVQYVLQQMVSEMHIMPYYYSAENSRGEIDFLIQSEEGSVPIEVKSEENLQAKSLRAFYDKFGYKGIRISMSDYRKQEWLTNIPLYAFMRWM